MDFLNEADKKTAEDIWNKLEKKLQRVAVRSGNKIPYKAVDGIRNDMSEKEIQCWTNGFWPALMYLMYQGTGNSVFLKTAETAENKLDKAFENFEVLNHDLGFMWHISSGAGYRITKNPKSRQRNLLAANLLMSRYNLRGNFIRAWNAECYGWSIIDCMMNIPLLYWASEVTADPRYAYVAMGHADSTLQNHVRADGSVNHIVVYDHINGDVLETKGGQGYGEGSSWSRGQAWGLYGFILSYIHTKKEEYLDAAKKIAHYFIANVCDDYLTRCDFRSPENPVIYDSTAGVIAACGLIEIAKAVGEFEKPLYLNAAICLIKATEQRFCDWSDGSDCIVTYGTEAYHCDESGKHIPIIYGDYFFAEAVYKLMGNDLLFW